MSDLSHYADARVTAVKCEAVNVLAVAARYILNVPRMPLEGDIECLAKAGGAVF